MIRDGLRPEDGAKFYGRIVRLGNGKIRAECYAELDWLTGVSSEGLEFEVLSSAAEASDWIGRTADRRGFADIHMIA
jgi:hypothetical protein